MTDSNEMIETLDDVVIRLEELRIDYMVTGSVAMSCYATARTTMDIDVIVEIDGSAEDRFAKRFEGDYYIDEQSIRRARQHQSTFNVLNFKTGIKVDFILRKASAFEIDKFKRRGRSTIGNVHFWVIGKEDLILSKLNWAKESHSEMQFRDIRNLLESGVDEEFITDAIKAEGLNDVWAAFSEWKIRIAK